MYLPAVYLVIPAILVTQKYNERYYKDSKGKRRKRVDNGANFDAP
jgi:hypothetical protein